MCIRDRKFGPVIRSIFDEYRRPVDKDRNIRHLIFDGYNILSKPILLPEDEDNADLEYIQDLISFVWKTYGHKSADYLTAWTHEKGGPWDKATKSGTEILIGKEVPNELIKEYFMSRMERLKCVNTVINEF